jgi:hypothetical protein
MKTSTKTLNIIFVILILFFLLGCGKEDSSKYLTTDERTVAINNDPSYLSTLWPIPLGPYYANPFTTNGLVQDFWYTDKDTCNVTIKLHAALTNYNRTLKSDIFDFFDIYNSATRATNGYLDVLTRVDLDKYTMRNYYIITNINLRKDGRDNFNLKASAYPGIDTVTYNFTQHTIRMHSKTTNAFYYNTFIVASHK